jgi:hypothetical protein
MDEKPYQLRESLSTQPGHAEKVEHEYRRKGTCSICMVTEQRSGWWHVEVLFRRTKKDWARKLPWLIDPPYPGA